MSCPFEVCPHDDAVLRVNDWSSMPTGTEYKWYYAENTTFPISMPPAGPWTFAGEGYEQNTNEIGPSTESWTNVWWIVTAQDKDGVCDPVLSAGCEIIVIQPPCAPIIADPSPNPKCPGDPVTLTATVPSGCGTIVSYQWYRNGKEFTNNTDTGLTIDVTRPGFYYLVVQGECESAQSNTVEVIDYEVEVTITGECCSEGNDITLTASGTSTCPSEQEHIHGRVVLEVIRQSRLILQRPRLTRSPLLTLAVVWRLRSLQLLCAINGKRLFKRIKNSNRRRKNNET